MVVGGAMFGFVSAGSAIALSIFAQAAPAGDSEHVDAEAEAQAAQLESILVKGRRLEEEARAFVREVGEPPRGTRLARWNRPVCVSVTNMQPRFAQFVIDRIAVNAFDAGADVGEPGCRPNVVVLATTEGPALAQRLVREAGLGFRPAIVHTNLNRKALRTFQTSDAPVRWWNVVMPVTTDTGVIATRLHGDEIIDPLTNTFFALRVRDGSHIRSNVRYDMAWTIVVVDMSKTGAAPFGALADYISMIALAQVDAEADLAGQSTIMNLFDAPGTVGGLTQWDKDYLAALYAAPDDRVSASQQENGVVRTLVRGRQAREVVDQEPVAED